MLKIFLSKIKKEETEEKKDEKMEVDDESDSENDSAPTISITPEQRISITSFILPEIISGYSSHQLKSQRLSESLFIDLLNLYQTDFATLLKKILAGLAGEALETRAASIQALTKAMKVRPKEFSTETLVKITKIVVLFMKDPSVYVQRVVLKLLKRIVGILSISTMEKELIEPLVTTIIRQVVN